MIKDPLSCDCSHVLPSWFLVSPPRILLSPLSLPWPLPLPRSPHSWSHPAPIPVQIPFSVTFPVPHSLLGCHSHIPSPILPALFPFSYSPSLCWSCIFISMFSVLFLYSHSQSHSCIPLYSPSPIFLIPIPYCLSTCCFYCSCPVPIFSS